MDEQQKKAFDEHVEWINQATDRAVAGRLDQVWQAIQEVDDAHIRSLVLVLVMARVDDAEWMRERMASWPLASDN